MPLGFRDALTNLSPHFFWQGWLHFLSNYHVDNLTWELGSYCPYHHLEILGRLLFILIGDDKGEQFKFALIPNPLEVGAKASAYGGNVMRTPF